MLDLKRKLVAVAVGLFLSVGVCAQRREGDKRPPKDPGKVVAQDKGQKPPQNSNQGGDKKGGDKKGKP